MTQLRSIAVAQTCALKDDVAANLDEHSRLAQIAASAGAQVILFPELSLTGYELNLARKLAFSEEDPRLSPLIEVSSLTASILIVGAPLQLGPRLHIGAFIICPDGNSLIYTKHYLGAFSESAGCDGIVPPAEKSVFQPGTLNPLVRFGDHMAAVAVCADIARPLHPQQAASRGAKTYLASMFVIPSEFEKETAKLQAYAVQHAMTVAFANYGSPSGGLAAAGRSAIWSETGALLAQLEAGGSGVAVATETLQGWTAQTFSIGAAHHNLSPRQTRRKL